MYVQLFIIIINYRLDFLEHLDMESMGMQWTHKNMTANTLNLLLLPYIHIQTEGLKFVHAFSIHCLPMDWWWWCDTNITFNKQVIFCSLTLVIPIIMHF